MTDVSAVPQPINEAGTATAEDGVVVLDGPEGLAITLTPSAAAQTGHSLISAAELAAHQASDALNRSNKGT